MLVKTKKVYYCEHCGRHRLTSNSIEKHEKRCTANINRVCGMGCENGIDLSAFVASLKARFEVVEKPVQGYMAMGHTKEVVWRGDPITIDEVFATTEGCPACTLAVFRLVGLNKWPVMIGEFDYQKANREWWAERNAEMEYPGY